MASLSRPWAPLAGQCALLPIEDAQLKRISKGSLDSKSALPLDHEALLAQTTSNWRVSFPERREEGGMDVKLFFCLQYLVLV